METSDQVVVAAILLDRHRILGSSALDVDRIDLILSERTVVLEAISFLLLSQLRVSHASSAETSVSRGYGRALLEDPVVQFRNGHCEEHTGLVCVVVVVEVLKHEQSSFRGLLGREHVHQSLIT